MGNIISGGSGKTPTVIALRHLLKEYERVYFLTRGYGGRFRGPLAVSLEEHYASDVGDEPLILAKHGATFIAKNRYQGALAIQKKQDADLIIMDDGFQNPTLKKNLSFIVFNGQQGIGNSAVYPAGPLRESLESGMQRAHAVIFYGSDKQGILPILEKFNKPIFKAAFVPDKRDIDDLFNLRVLAFSGLGYPEKFYHMLTSYDIEVVHTKSFPDHYAFTYADVMHLIKKAKKYGSQLVTTEKDFNRLPYDLRNHIKVVKIAAEFEKPVEIHHFIKGFIE